MTTSKTTKTAPHTSTNQRLADVERAMIPSAEARLWRVYHRLIAIRATLSLDDPAVAGLTDDEIENAAAELAREAAAELLDLLNLDAEWLNTKAPSEAQEMVIRQGGAIGGGQ